MSIPGIDVLTHHNPINTHIPHLSRPMPPRFELVVHLFPLVGTLSYRSAVINELPFLRVAGDLGSQAGVVR